jgi:hypothetical protein
VAADMQRPEDMLWPATQWLAPPMADVRRLDTPVADVPLDTPVAVVLPDRAVAATTAADRAITARFTIAALAMAPVTVMEMATMADALATLLPLSAL